MTAPLDIFATGAIAVAIVHTAMGIDHTLPFLVLGRAQKWSLKKTLGITGLCGAAHVASSVLLGLVGIRLGAELKHLQFIEEFRGNMAAWSLIIFGLTYSAWSFAKSRRLQSHLHAHEGGHLHAHEGESHAAFETNGKGKLVTAWSLFIIFVLGPCEPLIPLMMAPALSHGMAAAFQVVALFSFVTLCTMLAIVSVGYWGISLVPLKRLQIHANTLAGLAVAISGLAIQIFGI